MTMMATQEPTDPSVLLSTLNATTTSTTSTTSSTGTTTSSSTPNDSNTYDTTTSQLCKSNITDDDDDKAIPMTTTTTVASTTTSTVSNNINYNNNSNNNYSYYDSNITRTPTRSSLANDPNLTPIASIKRPRAANLQRSNSHTNNNNNNSANRSSTATPSSSSSSTMMMLMSPIQQQQQTQMQTPGSSQQSLRYTNGTTNSRNTNSTNTPIKGGSNNKNNNDDDETPLSPMHKIKPVLHRETVIMENNGTTTTTANSSPEQVSKDTMMIKDKVEEIFSPVVQFLHEHDAHHDPTTTTTTTKSTSEDISLDLNVPNSSTIDSTSLLHYNTEDEDDDDDVEQQQQQHPNHHHHHNVDDNIDDDDDDVSMSRPEDDSNNNNHHDNNGEFNPWQFIASLPSYDIVSCHRPPITLPPLIEQYNNNNNNNNNSSTTTRANHPQPPLSFQLPQRRKTLVLDLDETLVHCSVTEPTDHIVDFTFPVQFHGETYTVHVKCRPYLQQFLQTITQYFEIIVFTASQKVYADALLNIIDPDGTCIHHRLFRESCLAVEGNYLKDLNVLGRDLSRTVLVDNSPHAFGYQVDNGIPIESWFDDPNDRELLKLQRFLLNQILHADDVRIPVRNKFQSHVLIANAPPFQH